MNGRELAGRFHGESCDACHRIVAKHSRQSGYHSVQCISTDMSMFTAAIGCSFGAGHWMRSPFQANNETVVTLFPCVF